ncbi:hypothetical protein FALCPG4_008897 [Fusarium falciforme]
MYVAIVNVIVSKDDAAAAAVVVVIVVGIASALPVTVVLNAGILHLSMDVNNQLEMHVAGGGSRELESQWKPSRWLIRQKIRAHSPVQAQTPRQHVNWPSLCHPRASVRPFPPHL